LGRAKRRATCPRTPRDGTNETEANGRSAPLLAGPSGSATARQPPPSRKAAQVEKIPIVSGAAMAELPSISAERIKSRGRTIAAILFALLPGGNRKTRLGGVHATFRTPAR
jgi:hypothetical protein